MTRINCSFCGASAIAIRPGTEDEYGHPPDMFGFPDLRQKPVVMIPGEPDQGWCLEHWRQGWVRLERGVARL